MKRYEPGPDLIKPILIKPVFDIQKAVQRFVEYGEFPWVKGYTPENSMHFFYD